MKRRFFQLLLYAIILLLTYAGNAQPIKFNRLDLGETVFNGAITAISQDRKGYLWFTVSAAGGLFRYDGTQVTRYKNDPSNPKSIASNWVECMYIDSNDVIWIGTFGSGIDRFDPATGVFTHFRHNANNPKSLGNDSVIVIMKDRKGVMWVGDYMGLEKFDPATSTFTHYPSIKNDPTTLSNNEVRVIYEDNEGWFWVGTGSPWSAQGQDAGGLNRFDRATGKFTRYLHDPKDSTSLVNNKVRCIFEDSRGTFWVGTSGDGLHTMDRKKGTFQRHTFDSSHQQVIDILININ